MAQELFGTRRTPSLAEAMRYGLPMSPPNPISPPNPFMKQEFSYGSSSQSGLRCSPIIAEGDESEAQIKSISNQSKDDSFQKQTILEMERKICDQLDFSLKMHYKKIKSKFKKVKSRANQSYLSLEKLTKLLESISNSLNSEESLPYTQSLSQYQLSQIASIQPPQTPKLSWHKKSTQFI